MEQLKEFAKRINQLHNEIDEYRILTEQWQNPDLTQVFSPETLTIFENIVEQCETNSVKTDNDNNPDMIIDDQDIELISKYINIEPINKEFIQNFDINTDV